MAKVSIIIPVYNKEKYLKETLSSVDRQSDDDLEIIIIDDASTDNSFDIINDFVSNTKKQTKVIKNDNNCGVAHCRNIGIEEAKSDYITFLDADDILDDNFIGVMLNRAKQYYYVDFIRGNVCPFITENNKLNTILIGYYEGQIIVPGYNPNYVYEEIISCNGRLYKSDFIKNLRFVESSFEDYEFSLDTIISSASILYTNRAIYNYRIINDGKNVANFHNYFKIFSDYESIYDRILEKHPNLSFSISESIRKKQIYLHLNYLKVILNSDKSLIDRNDIIETVLMYLKCKYQLLEEEIVNVIGKNVSSDLNKDELQQKIKNLLTKY